MKNNLRYPSLSSLPEKTGGGADAHNSLDQGIQHERSGVIKAQQEVAEKLEILDGRSKTIFGTLLMREADKNLLKQVDEAKSEATEIILSSRNESLKVVAETMVRYNKALANTLLMTLETSNAAALDSHFLCSKVQLTEKMEDLNRRFVLILDEKEKEIKVASEMIKPMLRDQAAILLSVWMDDWEKIIHDFSAIRDKKFK